MSDPPRWASEVRVGHPLRDVRTDVARRDRRQPLLPEERREVLVDPPFGIDVRALAVRLVVVEHVLCGFVERDQADLGIDRNPTFDIALTSTQRIRRATTSFFVPVHSRTGRPCW